ncbi:glycosyl transferase family 2 [Hydrogenivirga caldilitoris]|uniref:Glycosyl transferase family 2 n=2 Tax=Hydrogenivirga caldilitoris TaxID=246264 RepID=A0A497XQL9_9AQUI|nr:glycosyl transferase family 2 [Hydrogenivirga caldilitoris]
MSIYNKEKKEYFRQSIESLLKQEYPFDEIVLVIDGPLPKDLYEEIETQKSLLKDKLVLVKNKENLGLAKSLNIGIRYCKNEYIARMDTDDISLPYRFRIQLDFLKKNPGYSLVGAWYDIYDENMKNYISTRKVPETFEEIKKFAKKRTPINHPTIMFKKSDILKIGGYPENVGRFEDWGLALKLIKNNMLIYNIPISVLHFRSSIEQMLRRGGIPYLIEEMSVLYKFKEAGFFSNLDFYRNILVRTPIRVLPKSIRYEIYKRFIWKNDIF